MRVVFFYSIKFMHYSITFVFVVFIRFVESFLHLHIIVIISLNFFLENDYVSIEKFHDVIQVHAKAHDYAMSRYRTKNDFKIDTLKKVVYMCNRENSFKQRDHIHKRTITIKCDCSFHAQKIYYKSTNVWILFVRDDESHNHEIIRVSSYVMHRKIEIIKKILNQIVNASKINKCFVLSKINTRWRCYRRNICKVFNW